MGQAVLSVKHAGFAAITFLLAIVGTLALLEVGLRLMGESAYVLSPDELWYRWRIARLRAGNDSGAFNPSYASDQYDPELGWVPQPGLRSALLNTNSKGLRGLREHPYVKQPGQRRIVVVGNSYTFGEGVTDEAVYTEVLDDLLDGVRVINLGVHGWGTDQQYLYLKRVGFDYHPDLVIVAFCWENADRNLLSFRDYAKPVFDIEGEALSLRNVPVPTLREVEDRSPAKPRCFLWGLAANSITFAVEHTRFAKKWVLMRMLLDAILEVTTEHGARLLVVYIPESLEGQPESAEVVLSIWSTEREAPFLNLREVFLEMDPGQRGNLAEGHWGPYGHGVAAGAIVDKVIVEGLLP